MPDKKNAKVTAKNPSAAALPKTPITEQQQSSFRTFIIIVVVVTVLVVLGGGYAIFQLSQANIKKNNEIRAQEAYLNLAKYKKKQLEDSEIRIAELKKSEGDKPSAFDLVTKRALPSKSDFESVINIMNNLQNLSLVTVENISLDSGGSTTTGTAASGQASAKPAGAQQLPIGVKISGGYSSIQDFFKRVESSVRVFDFQTMKLAGNSSGYTLDMKYQTYYLNEPNLDGKKVPLPEYEKSVSINKDVYK